MRLTLASSWINKLQLKPPPVLDQVCLCAEGPKIKEEPGLTTQIKAKKASPTLEESAHGEQHLPGGPLTQGRCRGCRRALASQHETVSLPCVGNAGSSCARSNSSAAGNDEFYIPAAGAEGARAPLLRGRAAPAARFLPSRGTHGALRLRPALPTSTHTAPRAALPLRTLVCLSPSVTPLQGSHI